MKEVFEKIIERLLSESICVAADEEPFIMLDRAIEIVNQAAEEYGDGWTPVSSGKFPEVEKEVFIQTKHGYITTAMYEDGTMYSDDSIWHWYDCDFEWDDEKEDYIISQGWWEYRHFNSDDVYNNIVDDEVIAWQPLPAPYQPNICRNTECPHSADSECPASKGCPGYQTTTEEVSMRQTNAERIQSMSIPELADILLRLDTCNTGDIITFCGSDRCKGLEDVPDELCKQCLINWLQSEVEPGKVVEQQEKQRWIPVTERLPENNDYILVSFENFSLADIARYEEDGEGGAFYPGDEEKSYSSFGVFVNAWMPLPKPYRPEEQPES